jgi:hypothetical protein
MLSLTPPESAKVKLRIGGDRGDRSRRGFGADEGNAAHRRRLTGQRLTHRPSQLTLSITPRVCTMNNQLTIGAKEKSIFSRPWNHLDHQASHKVDTGFSAAIRPR